MEWCWWRSRAPALLIAVWLVIACKAPDGRPAAAPATAAAPAASAAPATRVESVRLPERTRVVLGATPGAAFPAYIGLDRGYFAEANIELALEDRLSAAQTMPLLSTGEIDVASGAVSPGLFNGMARGLPIKVILDLSHFAPAGKSHMLLARQELYENGQLRDVGQLAGRRVAQASVPSPLVIDLDRALRRVQLSVADVELVQLPFAEHPLALSNGAVDAAVMFDPLASHATERGVATPIRYLAEDYPGHQVAVTMIGTRLLETPDITRAFTVAYLRAARDYERARVAGDNLGTVAAAIAKYTGQEPDTVGTLLHGGRMTATDPDGRVNVDSIRYDLEWYRGRGHVTQDLRLADFIDDQYAEYATRMLGPFR